MTAYPSLMLSHARNDSDLAPVASPSSHARTAYLDSHLPATEKLNTWPAIHQVRITDMRELAAKFMGSNISPKDMPQLESVSQPSFLSAYCSLIH